jgi:ParB family chromosome partitioning protein
VQVLIRERKLTMGHARALAALEEPARCITIAERTARLGLPVRAVERLAQATPKRRNARPPADPELAEFENRLRHRLGTQVRIHRRRGRGRIEIEFYNTEDLERVLDVLDVLHEV